MKKIIIAGVIIISIIASIIYIQNKKTQDTSSKTQNVSNANAGITSNTTNPDNSTPINQDVATGAKADVEIINDYETSNVATIPVKEAIQKIQEKKASGEYYKMTPEERKAFDKSIGLIHQDWYYELSLEEQKKYDQEVIESYEKYSYGNIPEDEEDEYDAYGNPLCSEGVF